MVDLGGDTSGQTKTNAWPRRETKDSSSVPKTWPRRETKESLAPPKAWPRRDVTTDAIAKKKANLKPNDEEWLLKAYEKRKEIKRKRKTDETFTSGREQEQPRLSQTPNVQSSPRTLEVNEKVVKKVARVETNVDDVSEAKPPVKIATTPATLDSNKAQGHPPTTVPKTSSVQPKKLEWVAAPSTPVDVGVDVSAWKEFAKKQEHREKGTTTVSDNFVRLTMRRRVRGSSGKAKKRPQYLRSTNMDDEKPKEQDSKGDSGVFDGIDVIEECFAQPDGHSNAQVTMDEIPVPFCAHGIPCQRLIVQKKNKNHGRAFFACTRRVDEGRCDFFLWEQNHPIAVAQAWTSTISNNMPELPPIPKFESALQTLRVVFGHADFKPGQQWAIERLLSDPNTQSTSLLVLPTGSGKSLCYQLPSLYLPGITLVISPLISLMADQLEKLPPVLRGRAASFSSTNIKADQATMIKSLLSGSVKLLYVSPERVVTAGFARLLDRIHVSLLCIDEAHCVSEWSHNFRPAFLRLGRVARRATKVLALTATASVPVTRDVSRLLEVPSEGIHRCSASRPNLSLHVQQIDHEEDRYMALRKLLSTPPLSKGSVIVYVHTQYAASQVAGLLASEGAIKASAYHASLDADIKEKVQKGFASGKIRVVVATIAFGMGIDKANVRGVVHYHMASSMEHYVQHIGRAGRDGKPATCVLLLVASDFIRFHSLAHSDGVSMVQVHSLMNILFASKNQKKSTTHPIAWLEEQLDMKSSVIETILTTLELRGYLELLPSLYATCTITVQQHQFSKWKADDMFAKVIAVAEVAVLQDGYLSTTTYVLNMVEFNDTAFPDRSNDDAAFLQLRRLQQLGVIQYKLSDYAFHCRVTAPEDLSQLAHEIYNHHHEQEERNVKRIETLYHVLDSAGSGDATAMLNQAIDDYFESESSIQYARGCIPWLERPLAPAEILDIQSATTNLLQDERITTCVISAQSITRILHGLPSPCFQAKEWQSHRFWSKFSPLPFDKVKAIVHDIVTEHKKQDA
ncbi:hypothetical protein LEN26_008510 [Aphanomyces euteiches]|nr:hypothetical protein LEN26_008510 [Aphanomyces euteiches]